MATHSSTLAWRIPWTEEPGVLQSMGHKEGLSMHTLKAKMNKITLLISSFLEPQKNGRHPNQELQHMC